MVQLANVFDARQVRPADPDGGSSFPVGHHPVSVVKSEFVNTKTGTGAMLVLTLRIYEGPNAGQEAPYRLNLYNQNAEAVRIANEQLSAICHVTGVYQLQETDALMNHPFIAVVEYQNDPKYPNGTQIRGVLDKNGDKPGQPGVKGAAPQQPRAAGEAPPAAAAPPAWQPPAAPPAGPGAGAWGPSSAPQPPQQPQQAPQPPQGFQAPPQQFQAPQQPQQPQQPGQFAPFNPQQPPQQPQQAAPGPFGAPAQAPQGFAAPGPNGGGQAPAWAQR